MSNLKVIDKITQQIVEEFKTSKTPLYPYYYSMRFQELADSLKNDDLNMAINTKPFLFGNSYSEELIDIYSQHSRGSLDQFES